jgi:hypothetical protein
VKEKLPWGWIAAVAPLPGLIAVLQLGRLHPDEVYQFLEPAFMKVFGYGVQAWEWQVGLRNWAAPGAIAVVLELCKALGIEDPWKRRAVIELPQAALHAWMLVAAYRLAARRMSAELARWAIPFVGLYMPVLTFAGRTLGESLSAAFLVVGLEFLDRTRGRTAPSATPPSKRSLDEAALAGGAVLGLSVVARYGSAAAVIGAMSFLLARRQWRDFALAAVGGGAVALGLGALDWATWGAPFHSLREYIDFNVISGKAAQQFGSEPVTLYLPFVAMLAPWAWLGLVRKPAPVFVAASVAYLLAIFATAHKEPRFLYPALVVLSVGAAPGAIEWLARRGKALVAAAALLSLPFFFFDTPFMAQRPEQFRLEAKAWPGATGLFITPEGTWGAGGAFWLGKNIPWFTCDFPQQFMFAARDPRFNRAVTWDKHYAAELKDIGFHVIEEQGPATLWGR